MVVSRGLWAALAGFVRVLSPWGDARGQGAPTLEPSAMTAMLHEVALGYAARGAASERAGRMLEAEALYARAVETDPGLFAAWLGYARALDHRHRREEAVRLLEALPRRALAGDGDLVVLAQALASLGQLDAALALLRGAPGAVTARAELELCAQAGRFPEALAAARRRAELLGDGPEGREARALVRALAQVVAEADAAGCPGLVGVVGPTGAGSVGALRRLLATAR
jgi:tetratricopeptide (TPR) repeat protein